MDNTIFAQSIGRIRALETKMLTKSKLDNLSEARGYSECIRMLDDSLYSTYVNRQSYEEGLKIAIEELYKEMYKIVPVRDIVDILAVKYDSHNIKSAIKGRLAETNPVRLMINAGTVPVREIDFAVREENYKGIPDTLSSSIKKAYERYENLKDPRVIDIEIDKGVFQYMLEIANKSKLDYLIEFSRLMIDVTNIRTFIRIKTQEKGIELMRVAYIPGGLLKLDLFSDYINESLDRFAQKIYYSKYYKWSDGGVNEFIKTGSLGTVEKFADNFIIEYLKRAKLISFGPEPIIAYITARENEIRAIRIILTGKANEVQADVIKERLRDVYA
jgi:V/A-type H+-transporting ATPase subunit C